MTTRRCRLVVVMTHPVQYMAPWFRELATRKEIDLLVLYAAAPSSTQQGVGFGGAFEWDIPLTTGYANRVVGPPDPEATFGSDSLFGINVPGIEAALLDERPDVVLVSGWHSITQLRVLWTSRKNGIPLLYRGDSNLQVAHAGLWKLLWRAKSRWLLSQFDGYLSVGRRAREFLDSFGIESKEIFDSPHAVDIEFFRQESEALAASRTRLRERFGLAADAFVILFVGKLEHKKRPQDLVSALAELGAPYAALFVGSGELLQQCESLAAELQAPASFVGFLNQAELPEAYACADCLVLPSGWGETWGLVVNEAMASGLPCVVSTRVGCAPDLVVPGETGECFEAGDIASLSFALRRLREWCPAGEAPVAACIERVEAFSYARSSDGLVRACHALTQGSPGA